MSWLHGKLALSLSNSDAILSVAAYLGPVLTSALQGTKKI